VWRGQIHVFQALYRLVPEARAALDCASRFIRTAIESPDELAPGSAERAA
jgi:hypothetical protein